MSSSFSSVHVADAQDQRCVVALVNEEHDQIANCVGLATCRVYIFAYSMSRFNKTVSGIVKKYLFGFIQGYSMLGRDFLRNLGQPDEVINVLSLRN
jgi:hypothetical protein